MTTDLDLDKALKPMTAIWFAMLFSLAFYLVVAAQIGGTIEVALDPEILEILRSVLYVLAVIILFITRPIRKLVLAGKGAGANRTTSAPLPALNHPLLQKYISAMMIALALSESVGIFGFVLYLLGKNAVDLYLLIALAAAAMCLYRPKKDELVVLQQEEEMRRLSGTLPQ